MIDEKKYEQQLEMISIMNTSRSGIVVSATGSGKSFATIKHIETCYDSYVDKILWVTSSVAARDTDAPNEFKKWNAAQFLSCIKFICYRSLADESVLDYDLVVLDEVHNITPLNATYFHHASPGNIIGLTATKPTESDKKDILFSSLGLSIIFENKLIDNIDSEILPDVLINAYLLPMSREKNVKITTKDGRFFMNSEHQFYAYAERRLVEALELGNPKQIKLARIYRYSVLNKMPSKAKLTKQLIAKLGDFRTIVFCASQAMCSLIDEGGQFSFHQRTNDSAMENFRTYRSNLLVCVDKLNESVNIDADRCILTNINQKDRRFIQRIGRILRSNDGKLRVVHVILMNNTSELESFKALVARNKLTVKYYKPI